MNHECKTINTVTQDTQIPQYKLLWFTREFFLFLEVQKALEQ